MTSKTGGGKGTKRKTTPATEFLVQAPDAQEVFVAGSFNGWEMSDEYKMRKNKGGLWGKKISLNPGSYEYLFVVDGSWWLDPTNPNRVDNGYGAQNSVLEVQ